MPEKTQNSYWRSSINIIPSEPDLIRQSNVPFTISVTPQQFYHEEVPLSNSDIIRCEKCKTYINPFVEIVPPGHTWKCNMCCAINNTNKSFRMKHSLMQNNIFNPFINKKSNSTAFDEIELKADLIDMVAPSSFSNRPPTDPVFFYLIEATSASIKNGMLASTLHCLISNLAVIPNSSNRTKIIIAFFNSSLYILKKSTKNAFLIISDFTELPLFYSDEIYFRKEEICFNIQQIIDYFANLAELKNDLGGSLEVISRMLIGGTALVFLTSVPNINKGSINVDKGSLKCKNPFYKEITGIFTQKQICINLFLFPQINLELPTLCVLAKFTGGCIFYNPNYTLEKPSFNSKFISDYCNFFDQNIGFDSVCKVRVPIGFKLKDHYGSFTFRNTGILSFCNYNSAHSFTFEVEVSDSAKNKDLCVQIAVLRTLESGERVLRVLNFIIPSENATKIGIQDLLSNKIDLRKYQSQISLFYDNLDSNQIVHYIALKSIYEEAMQKGGGSNFLTNYIKNINCAYKKLMKLQNKEFMLPEKIADLPIKVLGLMKSIPLRPSNYTPMDFKAFYIYLLYTQYPELIDQLILPKLYALHNPQLNINLSERLTLDCLEIDGFYLLDTGVNFYFFVAKECNHELANSVLNNAEGCFLFFKQNTELSIKVYDLISELRKRRFCTPNFYAIWDDDRPNVLMDIFFSYFVEDNVHGLPDLYSFLKSLEG